MGVTIPIGYAQAVVGVQLAGRPRPYGITFGVYDPTGIMTPVAIANSVAAALEFNGSLFDLPEAPWSQAYTYLGVSLTYMTDTGPVLAQNPASEVGVNVLAPLPPNVALLARKNTNRGGRKGRGRMFIPPIYIAESNVDALGTIDGASRTLVQNKLNVFMAQMEAGPTDVVLLHEDPSTAPDVVTAIVMESTVATQRRRLRS